MIDRISPAVMGAGVALSLGTAFLPSHHSAAVAETPIAGPLVAGTSGATGPRKAELTIRTVEIGVDAALRASFPASTEVLVRFVPVEASTVTIVDAATWRETSRVAAKATREMEDRRRRQPIKRLPEPVPAAAPIVAPPVVQAPPPPPEPTLPRTFSEIDEALRAATTTQSINTRLKKDGVSFRLTHVGRVRDRYVVRYAIANEETADFFLSIVNVTAGGKPIHAETAGPYACQTGQEIYGVVHFSPKDAAGRSVALELVQSGGGRRRFSLAVPYAF